MKKNKLSILYIGMESDPAVEIFRYKSAFFKSVTFEESVDPVFIENDRSTYDTVISLGTLEYSSDPVDTLQKWKAYLKDSGTMLLGMNNRLGIRFFCGEEDPYTGTRFDSIENYLRLSDNDRANMLGRCYDLYNIEKMLKQAGVGQFKRYSVYPCLEEPQLIYADGIYPKEDLAVRYFPKYRNNRSVFLEEEYMLDDLRANRLFHLMANAFLFECSKTKLSHVQHLTFSMDRGRKDALATIIMSNKKVIKLALYPEGIDKIATMAENHRKLKEAGVRIVPLKIEDDQCIIPYIEGENGGEYMKHLLYSDTDRFLKEMDRFKDIIYASSRCIIEDKDLGPILEKGYLDLVPLNCIYQNGEFVFFDQEFAEDMYPAKAILYRAISIIYWGHINDQNIYPYEEILKRYGLEKKKEHWDCLEKRFSDQLHVEGSEELSGQYHLRDNIIAKENRQEIAYGNTTFHSMFVDIFGDVFGKKIYVFGAGRWAKCFIDMYKDNLDIECIFDNDSSLWETECCGYKVVSPSLLAHMDPQEYKVFICVKDYKYILEQIKILGTKNIAIFNRYKIYPGRQTAYILKSLDKNGIPKKYRIGYIAGVFDLFHIGHLNMFRRAKEQCDYLVVGVVSDEQVRRNKHKEPFVPFDERIDIVRSCKYVDEAMEIPIDFSGTVEAFQKYHFDVQFSGSDYVEDPWWLEQKAYLESQGAELVFFPYTQSTSSSMLQQAIKSTLELKK